TVTTPPGRPPVRATALSVTVSSATQTELSWIDNSDEENGYIVERSEAGLAYQVIATLAENSTSYIDNGVRASSKYSYRVKAYNDAGESDYSDPSSITLPNESGQFAATVTIKYIVANHLGTPAVITDSNGAIISRHDSYPFGEEIELNLSGRTAALGYNVNDGIRQRFTSYERDVETGLDFAQARYYSSPLGRFMSPDEFTGGPVELFNFAAAAADNPTFYAEIANPQTLNKYQYVLNNPLRFIDPNGHQNPAQAIDAIIKFGTSPTGARVIQAVASATTAVGSVGAAGIVAVAGAFVLTPDKQRSSGRYRSIDGVPETNAVADILDRAKANNIRSQADDVNNAQADPVKDSESEAHPSKVPQTKEGSPALENNPYSPKEVSKRQSETRRKLGTGNEDPDSPIPDQNPGHNIKGSHSADTTPHHGTGERNVGTVEEHSRKAKGSHGLPKNTPGPRN
ncbi:MAG: RHS repeat-associated core domain-containing protein, partial [Acidobacteriota bacterium]